jgi:hypothetical protein
MSSSNKSPKEYCMKKIMLGGGSNQLLAIGFGFFFYDEDMSPFLLRLVGWWGPTGEATRSSQFRWKKWVPGRDCSAPVLAL